MAKRVDNMNAEEVAQAITCLSTSACMLCPIVERCDQLNAAGLYDSGWRCEKAIAEWLLEEVDE